MDMETELKNLIASVKNTYLSKLLQLLFAEDEKFMKEFKSHSAAKTVHHSFVED
jgi:3'-5' exoribonuclease